MQMLIAWILAFMTVQAPVTRQSFVKEAQETPAEATARYESIAKDIIEVVYDPSEPPLFKGKNGRVRTISLILSVMLHESGFRKDVDLGVGKVARGDGGRSVCMMQINLGPGRLKKWNKTENRFARPGDPPDQLSGGWNAAEMLADRKNCIRGGLQILRTSFASGSRRPIQEWLNVYASGNPNLGREAGARRINLALTWYGNHKPSFTDADILEPAAPAPAMPVAVPGPGPSPSERGPVGFLSP